ncbi:MAG: hypothetical protein AUH39_00225 [Chloroflexi bacterium 13_1_40CM_67_9]|nr:MAG: hypothetical protein AUH39_00225 [Chloroflexi bacterium 13_1_40CM_67_9]
MAMSRDRKSARERPAPRLATDLASVRPFGTALTPVPTRTLPPVTPAPTIVPSAPVGTPPLPSRTP